MGEKPADVPEDEIGPARSAKSLRAQERTIQLEAQGGDTRAPGDLFDLPPMPKRVGGFTLIEPLGTGGMGHVYLARQDSLERLVALKVLRNELAKDKVYLERFQREAKAAALFSHPHVVSVIDTGHDPREGLNYIAFEYVDGGSLESLVRAKGAIAERRALEITKAIALALQFAESRRLVHRDLKPANVLLASDGTPKLADLGLVRQAERVGPQVTQEGVILGTPLYMAPEQALGRELDVRADIYSLGLCLYRMLTGRIPFGEEDGDTCSTLAILSRHVNEELPDPRAVVSSIGETTVRLMADMTARDVERRYRSASHVAQEIDRLLAGQPLQGARALQCSIESEAPTTAVTGIRPEDLLKPVGIVNDPTPTVAAPAALVAAAAADAAAAAVRVTDAGPVAQGAGPPTVSAPVLGAPPVPKPASPATAVQAPPAPPPPGAGGWSVVAVLALAAAGTVGLAVALVKSTPPRDPAVATTTPPPPTEPARPATESARPATEPTRPVTEPLRPPDPPPVRGDPVTPTPIATTTTPPPRPATERSVPAATETADAPRDLEDAIDAAQGDPDALAGLVRDVSRTLFLDVPRGRALLRRLLERGGWAPSPLRDRFHAAFEAIDRVLEPGVAGWDERERRLQEVVRLTRERLSATPLEKLKAAVDAELQLWSVFAVNANRVRLALGDPRTEEHVLELLEALPEDRFVREDARALFAMGRAADQPARWVRFDDRRQEVALAVSELRERIERTALTRVVAEEAAVLCSVLERQLDDLHASFPTALVRAWSGGVVSVADQRCDPQQSVFLQARRREVPQAAPWTHLTAWALEVELGAPLAGQAGVTVTIDEKMSVHLGPAGVVVAGSFRPCRLAAARRVLIEPRFDGILLRMPGASPPELMVPIPEGPVVPVRFSVRAKEAQVSGLVLVRLPDRQVQDPKSVRGESVRRQRQGR